VPSWSFVVDFLFSAISPKIVDIFFRKPVLAYHFPLLLTHKIMDKKISKMADDKLKVLKLALDKIEKDYGKGSVMMLGDKQKEKMDVISTGSIGLDVALGVGGLPAGRIVEIYGPESSGKTTIAIHTIAESQKKGGICAIIDAEHAFDASYARKLGVDVDNLIISQPDYGEQGLEIADRLISSGAVDVVVIDSVAALVPKGELEGEMGESKMGLQARLMSQALRKLTATISRTGCCCIFINQLREKIGVMFGNPETTTGGNALKFYASVRLDIRRISQIKDGDVASGNRTRVKVVKNKVAPPFRQVEFDIIFGEGISKVGEIIDMGVELGILQKSGSWFAYGDSKIGQGRDAVKQFLGDNPEVANEVEAKIRAALQIGGE
jgi:recombination protein RecA